MGGILDELKPGTRERRSYDSLKEKLCEADVLGKGIPKWYTDHGRGHSERVIENIDRINPQNLLKLNSTEAYILLCSAWLHDIATAFSKDYKHHHILGKEFIEKDKIFDNLLLGSVRSYIALIVEAHRREQKIDQLPESVIIGKDVVRLQLLVALLRLADALDITEARAPEIRKEFVKKLPYEAKIHWEACRLITGWTFNHSKHVIEVSAHYKTDEEKALIIWKVDDLCNELSYVVPTLNKYGLTYVGLEAKLVNERTGKEETIFKTKIVERPAPLLIITHADVKIKESGKVTYQEVDKYLDRKVFDSIKKSYQSDPNQLRDHLMSFLQLSGFSEMRIESTELDDKESSMITKASGKVILFDGKYLILLRGAAITKEFLERTSIQGNNVIIDGDRVGPAIIFLKYYLPENAKEIHIEQNIPLPGCVSIVYTLPR